MTPDSANDDVRKLKSTPGVAFTIFASGVWVWTLTLGGVVGILICLLFGTSPDVIGLGAIVGAALGILVAMRPSLTVYPDRVLIRNLLSDHEIKRSDLRALSSADLRWSVKPIPVLAFAIPEGEDGIRMKRVPVVCTIRMRHAPKRVVVQALSDIAPADDGLDNYLSGR